MWKENRKLMRGYLKCQKRFSFIVISYPFCIHFQCLLFFQVKYIVVIQCWSNKKNTVWRVNLNRNFFTGYLPGHVNIHRVESPLASWPSAFWTPQHLHPFVHPQRQLWLFLTYQLWMEQTSFGNFSKHVWVLQFNSSWPFTKLRFVESSGDAIQNSVRRLSAKWLLRLLRRSRPNYSSK